MLKIGLTGGIGSGKSIVAKYFTELGIEVIDTDRIAHEITAPNTPALKAIVKKFGKTILNPDGTLDRPHLRTLIFQKPDAKKWLEKLLHPLIIKKMQQRIKKVTTTYCILIIPLLFEAKLQQEVDRILVVDAEEKQQIKRTRQRDQVTAAEVQKIIATQINREQRLAQADDIIYNNESLMELRRQVQRLHEKYLHGTETNNLRTTVK